MAELGLDIGYTRRPRSGLLRVSMIREAGSLGALANLPNPVPAAATSGWPCPWYAEPIWVIHCHKHFGRSLPSKSWWQACIDRLLGWDELQVECQRTVRHLQRSGHDTTQAQQLLTRLERERAAHLQEPTDGIACDAGWGCGCGGGRLAPRLR
jgi:hypothetical protein